LIGVVGNWSEINQVVGGIDLELINLLRLLDQMVRKLIRWKLII
jgi:hypothetical protein